MLVISDLSHRIDVLWQDHVAKELQDLQAAHHNIEPWQDCAEDNPGCLSRSEDVWERVEGQPSSSAPGSLAAGETKIQGVRDDAADPVSTRRWLHRTVGPRLFRLRKAQLLAAYRLHNCLVAAEQDRGTVRVRILEPRTRITTVKSAPQSVYRHRRAFATRPAPPPPYTHTPHPPRAPRSSSLAA